MSVLDRFRLDHKRLFITGGSRGLGREMAIACAEAGADVILVGREQVTLDATAEEIRGRGRQADVIVGDVAERTRLLARLEKALEQIETVRAHVGPDIDLLIEAHGRFDVPTAIRVGKAIADYDLGAGRNVLVDAILLVVEALVDLGATRVILLPLGLGHRHGAD